MSRKHQREGRPVEVTTQFLEWEVPFDDSDVEAMLEVWTKKECSPDAIIESALERLKIYSDPRDMLIHYRKALLNRKGKPSRNLKVRLREEVAAEVKWFAKQMRTSVVTLLTMLANDRGVDAQADLAFERERADWHRRRDKLPTLYRYYVAQWEESGNTDGPTFRRLKAGTYWPKPTLGGPNRKPMRVVADRAHDVVTIDITLPSLRVGSFKRKGYCLMQVVRCMTTWGSDRHIRRDLEVAWFGHPVKKRGGMLGVINGCEGSLYRRVSFSIPFALWVSVKAAATLVSATPEEWIFGCVLGLDFDEHADHGDTMNEVRSFAGALEKRSQVPSKKGGVK